MECRFNGVSERDMDLLFLEEFAINRDFLYLFTEKIEDQDLSSYEVVSGEVSYVDAALGESDLTIILGKDAHRVGLLIEDKIAAVAQPRQYERYVERGEDGKKANQFDSYYVFLIAPAKYIEGNESARKYPLKVQYEECQRLFEVGCDARSKLKYRQLEEAIKQGHKPYTKIVDAVATSFWDNYVRYMHTYYPDIALKSKVTAKSRNGDWPTYRTGLDMKEVYIHHKMKMKGVGYSNIDLTFENLAEYREQLKELLQEMLGDQYDRRFGVHKAGKSAVLRLVAPQCLDWQAPFENQVHIVREHLDMISVLCKAANKIEKDRLLALYADASAARREG